ncbi:MAG: phosphatidylcholine synthase [Hyphomicrobiales bacterium]|nr:phosphatidylcholine synthase [Hyphomicrobiales bacterium]
MVHGFTATGAFLGMLALERAFAKDFSAMFGWLALAFLVDGIDGTLARRIGVRGLLPYIDGDMLDAVVDYLTYVIVPLAALWASGIMPPALSGVALAAVATTSAIYFADRRMKTKDNWFRGFPALWNVVVLYLFAFPMPGVAVFAIVIMLCAAMFVPIVFVHPVRVQRLRAVTLCFLALWLASAAWLIWRGFPGPLPARAILAMTGIYFVTLPLWRTSVWASSGGAHDDR